MLEMDISEEVLYFHRTWLRYVNYVYAILNGWKSMIEEHVSILYNRCPPIKFTFAIERRNNSKLHGLVIGNNSKLWHQIKETNAQVGSTAWCTEVNTNLFKTTSNQDTELLSW